MNSLELTENFFRHEYGKLVAVISNRIGVEHIESIEDCVQSSLIKALETWTSTGLPDNPSAWLFRVSLNGVLDELRTSNNRLRILEQYATELTVEPNSIQENIFNNEINDDVIRMLFICCDGILPENSQIVFALKTLCGFSVKEIALRLFTSEANIYKRLTRAKSLLQKNPPTIGELIREQYSKRVPAVNKILYIIFTEGYLSSHYEVAIRRELCDEAIRLTSILAEHPVGQIPETLALLALMHLHLARLHTRQDASGGLLLLEEQDRSLWDKKRIQIGLEWLAKSSTGNDFTRYHAEAGIAAEHCLSPSFKETRWDKVAEIYELLENIAPSALHKLNRAVAVAEWKGPEDAIKILAGFVPPTWLAGSYLWFAVLADLHRRTGNQRIASKYQQQALNTAPTKAIKSLLMRRMR